MFEKEAEDSFMYKKVLYKWETDKRSYIDGFKDGATFGYDKANELEKEKCELLGVIQGKDKVIQELKELNNMLVSKNQQLAKAKELIEELSSSLSVVGECEEEECELLNQAEQFLKENT